MKRFISIIIAIMMVLTLGVSFMSCTDKKEDTEETTAGEVIETTDEPEATDVPVETDAETGDAPVEDIATDTTVTTAAA